MKTNKGLTLIEVLIALAILSIALTAIIKSSSQSIKHTQHLEEKIAAHMLASNIANEILAGVKVVAAGKTISDDSAMLNNNFTYKASLENTKNPEIKEIKVKIFQKSSKTKIYQLESYLYVNAS